MAFQGAEDVIETVVFFEVFAVAFELVFVVGEVVLGCFEGATGVGDGFGFAF